jgi:predicted amidohydrolase YtcJ
VSRDEALARVRDAFGAPRDGRVLAAEGLDESAWADARLPTRDDVDAISRDVPIILRRVCLHKAVANSAALALLERDDAHIDYDAGALVEHAVFTLDEKFLAPSPEDRIPGIERAARLALSRGVTMADEISSWPSVLAMRRLAEEGRLQMRIRLHILYEDLPRARAAGLHSGQIIGPQGRLTIGGIKLFVDGSLGARTAALRAPYADAPSARGLLLLSEAELSSRIREIEKAGFYALAHVIGDAALDVALAAFAAAGVKRGIARGHRLEHVEIVPDDETLERLARSGLAVYAQPNFVGNWGGARGLYETRLGVERARLMNRFASLRRAGVPLRFSSDAMPIDPLYGLRSAAAHPVESERLAPRDAVECYLADPGSAHDDYVMLSESPERAAVDPRARVLATALDGSVVFADDEGAASREILPAKSGLS